MIEIHPGKILVEIVWRLCWGIAGMSLGYILAEDRYKDDYVEGGKHGRLVVCSQIFGDKSVVSDGICYQSRDGVLVPAEQVLQEEHACSPGILP
jgi:hypothetical protein